MFEQIMFEMLYTSAVWGDKVKNVQEVRYLIISLIDTSVMIAQKDCLKPNVQPRSRGRSSWNSPDTQPFAISFALL